MYQETHPLGNITNIIAIAAGKGGVGKSTVTVNLALALKKLGFEVAIMGTPSLTVPPFDECFPKIKYLCRGTEG